MPLAKTACGDARIRPQECRERLCRCRASLRRWGGFATLREVVDHYDHGVKASPQPDSMLQDPNGNPRQMNLTEEQKEGLIAFLNAMTDEGFLHDPRFSDPFL